MNKFVTIYGIAANFGMMMHPYATFLCTKLQGYWIAYFTFSGNFYALMTIQLYFAHNP